MLLCVQKQKEIPQEHTVIDLCCVECSDSVTEPSIMMLESGFIDNSNTFVLRVNTSINARDVSFTFQGMYRVFAPCMYLVCVV